MDKTMQEHLQSVIDELKDIVENHPFHAFALLAIVIEVLGKSINSHTDWQHFERNGFDFNNALTKYQSLKKYSTLKVSLYDTLRCGMAHAFLPKEGIKLVPDKNDFSNDTIGCKELYEDIVIAWSDLKKGVITPDKDMSKNVIKIIGPTTGVTNTDKSQIV